MKSLFERPLTHELTFSSELQEVGNIQSYRVQALCRACRYYWSTDIYLYYIERLKLTPHLLNRYLLEELTYKSLDLYDHHQAYKKPDVHLLDVRPGLIYLDRRKKLTYACGEQAWFNSDADPVRNGLDILFDDMGEGFSMKYENITCEHCVRVWIDPLIKFHNKQKGIK